MDLNQSDHAEGGTNQLSGREKVTILKGCQMEDSHQPIYAKTSPNADRRSQKDHIFKDPFQGYFLKTQVKSWSSFFFMVRATTQLCAKCMLGK